MYKGYYDTLEGTTLKGTITLKKIIEKKVEEEESDFTDKRKEDRIC